MSSVSTISISPSTPPPREVDSVLSHLASQAVSHEAVTPKFSPEESIAKLKEVTQTLNELMKTKEMGLSFSIDARSGRVVMTVIDANSGALIRKIPGDDVLRVSQSIEGLKGLLFNKSL